MFKNQLLIFVDLDRMEGGCSGNNTDKYMNTSIESFSRQVDQAFEELADEFGVDVGEDLEEDEEEVEPGIGREGVTC